MVAQFWTHFRASPAGAVAAQQGFPEVVGRSESSDANGGDVAVALPDGIETGHRLIVAVACSNFAFLFTWPDGWTSLVSSSDNQFSMRMEIGTRVVDGSEGFTGEGDSITVTTAAAAAAAVAWCVADQLGVDAALSTGVGTTANHGAHNPSGWAMEKTLWLAILANDGNRSITYPDTHPLARRTLGVGSASGGVTLSAAELKAAVESLDQGVWTIAADEGYVVASIAIRPAAA